MEIRWTNYGIGWQSDTRFGFFRLRLSLSDQEWAQMDLRWMRKMHFQIINFLEFSSIFSLRIENSLKIFSRERMEGFHGDFSIHYGQFIPVESESARVLAKFDSPDGHIGMLVTSTKIALLFALWMQHLYQFQLHLDDLRYIIGTMTHPWHKLMLFWLSKSSS